MNIRDVITFEDNTEFVILDIVNFNNEKYLYCVGIDKGENPTSEFKYFKGIEENNEYYVEEILDKNELNGIINMFKNKHLIKSDEQEV